MCVVQSSRVDCQNALECEMLMSSNEAGGHSNKLMVTAVALLLPVCLSPKSFVWQREGLLQTPKVAGNVVSVCQTLEHLLCPIRSFRTRWPELKYTRSSILGHINEQYFVLVHVCLLLSVFESPRMFVLRCGRRGGLESRRCVMTRTAPSR